VDLKRFVIEPAVKQINENPEGSGFTVKAEPVKKGRAVAGIRFTLSKTKARIAEKKPLR
jgi:plasmid replication initiation protein